MAWHCLLCSLVLSMVQHDPHTALPCPGAWPEPASSETPTPSPNSPAAAQDQRQKQEQQQQKLEEAWQQAKEPPPAIVEPPLASPANASDTQLQQPGSAEQPEQLNSTVEELDVPTISSQPDNPPLAAGPESVLSKLPHENATGSTSAAGLPVGEADDVAQQPTEAPILTVGMPPDDSSLFNVSQPAEEEQEQDQNVTEALPLTAETPFAANVITEESAAAAAAVLPEPIVDIGAAGAVSDAVNETTLDAGFGVALSPEAASLPLQSVQEDSNSSSSSSSTLESANNTEDVDASSHERSYGTWPEGDAHDASVASSSPDAEDAGAANESSRPVTAEAGSRNGSNADDEQHVQLLSSTLEKLPLPSFDEALSPEEMHKAWATDRSLHPSLDDAAAQVEGQDGDSLLASEPGKNSSQTPAIHDEL